MIKTTLKKNVRWAIIHLDRILSLTAIIISLLPYIINFFKPVEIKGKLISLYENYTVKKDGNTESYLLLKLNAIALNHSFPLKDIDIDVKYEKNGWFHGTSQNSRAVIFLIDSSYKKLNVPTIDFLNNYAILKENEPNISYLITSCPYYKEDKIELIKIIFKNYEDKKIELIFNNPYFNEKKWLFDDNIWIPFEPKKNPLDSLYLKYSSK